MTGQSCAECAGTMRALRRELQQAAEDRSLEGIALLRVDGTRPADGSPGDGDGLVAFFERQVAERERDLGPDDPDTLLSLSNLAYAHHRARNRERSAELFARALTAGESHLGPDHPATRHVQELLSHVRGG
ncbi:tetratricopeptide repeat protein [Streptomyces sp. SD15]